MPIRRKRRSGKASGKTCGQVARFALDKPLANRWIGEGQSCFWRDCYLKLMALLTACIFPKKAGD
jgi:hypothetical protein